MSTIPQADNSQPGPSRGDTSMIEPRIGDFLLDRKLGEGGMGVVFRAKQSTLDRFVAIKFLSSTSSEGQFVERFYREARSAAKLVNPHIIQVYMVGEHRGMPYFVMEYVEGVDIGYLLRETGRFNIPEAVEVVRSTARALAVASENGIVHRDIKPQNIMSTKTGLIKVMDFGLAKAKTSGSNSLTQEGQIVGTPTYMPPEQARGGNVDIRSDLYSLGCVLYECLTGEPPFDADNPVALIFQHLEAPVIPPNKINSTIPQKLSDICVKLLAKSPDQRFQKPEMLNDALANFVDPGARPEQSLIARVERVLGSRAAPPDIRTELRHLATLFGPQFPESRVSTPIEQTARTSDQLPATVIKPRTMTPTLVEIPAFTRVETPPQKSAAPATMPIVKPQPPAPPVPPPPPAPFAKQPAAVARPVVPPPAAHSPAPKPQTKVQPVPPPAAKMFKKSDANWVRPAIFAAIVAALGAVAFFAVPRDARVRHSEGELQKIEEARSAAAASLSKNDLSKAIEFARKAVELDSDDAPSRDMLGSIYMARGEYLKAIEHGQKAVELQPQTGSFHSHLGVAFDKADDYEKALKEFDEAIKLNHDVAHNQMYRAMVLQKLDRLEEAVEAANSANKLRPGDAAFEAALMRLKAAQATKKAEK